MQRREFITLIGGAAFAWPLELRAQEPGRTYRLSGLTPSPRDAPHYAALFDQLRQLGFIEGQNLTIDWRGYGARTEQFRDIAVELVKARPDVIFCAGDIAVRAAQQATATIPILAVTDDMVGAVSDEAAILGHFRKLVHRWQAQRRGALNDEPTIGEQER